MNKRLIIMTILAMVMGLATAASAGAPSFSGNLWGDGVLWGTKSTTALPTPTSERNLHSFDKLFIITNSNNPDGQKPVSEAAPGNPDYNGGRWYTHTVVWTDLAFEQMGIVPVLTSYDDLMLHETMEHLMIVPGSPEGGPMPFFQCPLLPVKHG